MFPTDIVMTYLAACLLVVLAPGPDNLLAIGRGLSQGRAAAALSALGAGVGILFHTLTAALGLSVILQSSAAAFWAIKAVGAVYLIGRVVYQRAYTRAPSQRALGFVLSIGPVTVLLVAAFAGLARAALAG